MNTITLDVPAGTFVGLREQAKALNIAGRGRMNKEELTHAVTDAIALRTAERDVAARLVDTRPPVIVPDYTAVAAIKAHTFIAPASDAPPAVEVPSPLTVAARLARTRTGRRDYPATKQTRRNRKGGRK